MGLLDSIFGGGARQGGGSGPSPLTLGLLALLAYRTYRGQGRLADMLGRGQQPDGTRSFPTDSPTGIERAPGGGLGGLLGGLFGGGARPASPGATGGGVGDLLRGGLGGVLGGAAAGTLLNGGLGDLLRRFQDNGYGDTAQSWIGKGPNREIAPDELEQAVGRDTLQDLSEQSGRPYDEVLSELSRSLPNTVDQLTPEGRLPSDDEAARWI